MASQPKSPPPKQIVSGEFSTYELEKLRSLWQQEAISAEQLLGHLLQHALEQEKRLRQLEGTASRRGG